MAGWLTMFMHALLPPACVGCRASGAWWCKACAAGVVPCRRIPYCPDGLRGLAAGAYFREPLATAVRALKYRHVRAVGTELVRYLESPLARAVGTGGGSALLVPIPLHPARQRNRGHNQAAVLAESLSRRSGVPWRNALYRTRATPSQTGLQRQERFANVAGAFEWQGQAPDGAVILVDDVITTGATFQAAACAVHAAAGQSGTIPVFGVAVAYRQLAVPSDKNR